jgi:SAM-dependent methyltransferase
MVEKDFMQSHQSIFENDIVMGTFTHRTTYLPNLLDSVKRHLPHIPFIVHIADAPIVENFEALRKKFQATNKRFWLFLDDDIQFLDGGIIKTAITQLLANKWAMIGAYSTFDPLYPLGSETLECKEIPWMPGYFQLIDSQKIGDIQPDFNLPDSNTSIDTSYCVIIKSLGHRIGICSGIVYHTYKIGAWVHRQDIIDKTNEYLMKRWGQYYFDICQGYFNIKGNWPTRDFSLKGKMISFDLAELIRKREELTAWQQIQYQRSKEEKITRLHLGCGRIKYPGYVNCDIQGDVDQVVDLQVLPFADNSIDEISCHHALEHIPYRKMESTLREWYRALKPGGVLDLGLPDIDLVCKQFLLSTEEEKWQLYIYTIFGQQGTTEKSPHLLTDDDPLDYGQFHQGGVTLERLRFLLEKIGFKIDNIFNYDGCNTPSIWVLARKEDV